MADLSPDVWTCPDCYSENVNGTVCQMCHSARPKGSRSVLLVDKNSTHPAVVAARRGRRPPSAATNARSARSAARPVAARESPSRGAKDTANRRIAAQLAHRTPIPVAEVVHSPVTSPDSPAALAPPPAVARAGTGTGVGLGDDKNSSSDSESSPSPFRGVGQGKTTGLDASPNNESVIDYGCGTDPDDDWGPTDGEVSKYSFFQRLIHYMDGNKIDQQNRKAVELAILVEAVTVVCNMDPMKKATCEQVLLRKYIELIQEIEDGCFEDATIRCDMLSGYKGGKARQGLSGANLLRKLEREMTDIRKFAVRFPGFNNPAGLPSGLTQLRDMKARVVATLWKSKYPVMCC
jgi:hypothetical protein